MVKFFTWVLILLVIAGFFILTDSNSKIKKDLISGSFVNENILDGDVKVFSVTGDRLRFWTDGLENPDIVVKKGDLVRINFKSTEGFHDWIVDEFDATTQRVTQGQTTFVEFVADQKGEFSYYCNVGQHRISGMEGKLIVK